MSLVIDASAALAWIFERENSQEAQRADDLLNELEAHPAWVPGLWAVEVANALLVAERRRVVQEAQVVDYLQRLGHLPINADDCSAQSRQEAVIALGRQLQLTAYDATYVELALRKGAHLATFDQRLARAVREVGGDIY